MAGRPTWDDYFIGLAYHASLRSHDSQTQVGCVIVSDNKAIGMGYNGFCSNVEDEDLPTTRPQKYVYIVHAEQNAVSNIIIKPPHSILSHLIENGLKVKYIKPNLSYLTKII